MIDDIQVWLENFVQLNYHRVQLYIEQERLARERSHLIQVKEEIEFELGSGD